jgi:hypothetical protein
MAGREGARGALSCPLLPCSPLPAGAPANGMGAARRRRASRFCSPFAPTLLPTHTLPASSITASQAHTTRFHKRAL